MFIKIIIILIFLLGISLLIHKKQIHLSFTETFSVQDLPKCNKILSNRKISTTNDKVCVNYWDTPVFFQNKIHIPTKNNFVYKAFTTGPATIQYDMNVYAENAISKCQSDPLVSERVTNTITDVREYRQNECESKINDFNKSTKGSKNSSYLDYITNIKNILN